MNRGVRALRLHHEGALQYQERRADVRYIVESATGQLLIPVEPGFAKSGEEMIIWSPREDAWAMQIVILARVVDRPESLEGVDRWQAYHAASGLGSKMTWVRGEIEGLKTREAVYGAEDCVAVNPLGRDEYGLIKKMNADREVLARAVKRLLGVAPADALCVGVDPWGVDVRARFGIMRVEFADGISATTIESAEREVMRLLAGA
ncbi:MAG: hypothetical protein K2W85_01300 [Phycisphaerales bacterium]|nr:hypothetical protein [Phycisphaerales bacterium]